MNKEHGAAGCSMGGTKLLSDGAEKAEVIHNYHKKFPYSYFIETGTSYAETLIELWNISDFNRMYSFEKAADKYINCVYLTDFYSSIKLIHGDSAEHLPRLIEYLKQPAIVFLDAHPDENEPTPILKELAHFFYYAADWPYVILIDDARCFDEFDQWPDLEVLKELAERNNYTFEVQDDLIRMEPPH